MILFMGSANNEVKSQEKIMFTQDNTQGYTDKQLAAFNAELAQRLEGVADEDRQDVEKAFHDEVAGR